MSQRTMEAHYRPNWELTQARGLLGYNCGYAAQRGNESFDEHQQSLVWRLLGDTQIDENSVVLDVGCGIGGPSGWMFERFKPKQLFGLEYLGSSVQAAGERWRNQDPRPTFLQGDAHHIPLADNQVDVIFNLESALHYKDKRQFISECKRVLKPGGRLCLGDITTRRKWLFLPVEMTNSLPSQFTSSVWLWSASDYKAAFRELGFKLLNHENAAAPIADSLADGLDEIKGKNFVETWGNMRGFRGRVGFLGTLRQLLRLGMLDYDLFQLEVPDGNG